MKRDCDILIIGSGPAGVSAALPLVKAGLNVLMVDGGRRVVDPPPTENFLVWRRTERTQSRWMVGSEFQALKMQEAVSPKLRVPSLGYVFEDFEFENRVVGNDFVTIGSLATGGLSNAWGCGVARFSNDDLAQFPFQESQLLASYETVSRRIGISGRGTDDLSDYFGLDAWSQPPVPLDTLHAYMLEHYRKYRNLLNAQGFVLGRSRVAALTEAIGDRKPCERTGNCLWGCSRRALYSAVDEIPRLMSYGNFTLRSGFVVRAIARRNGSLAVEGSADGRQNCVMTAKKILVAAGTLATTRLVLTALGYQGERKLLSCPTAAFLAWVPRFLGAQRTPSFGLGQLSFALNLTAGARAMGSTFSTTGVPVSEFVSHAPLRNRYMTDILKNFLGSCVVGNVFLPGEFGAASARLSGNGQLIVSKSHDDTGSRLMVECSRILQRCFRKLGAVVIPGSFTVGKPGGDIHYAGTLPMRREPQIGETDSMGEVQGLDGVHVVDGASLSGLPEKSHTLTIMANADRIARRLVELCVSA